MEARCLTDQLQRAQSFEDSAKKAALCRFTSVKLFAVSLDSKFPTSAVGQRTVCCSSDLSVPRAHAC